MDTSLLRCFLMVSDVKSFSTAAARLNVTQSTVSHKIARLEEHLGKRLFERTTRSCRLTADGRDLISYAVRTLRSVDEMEQNFKPQLLNGTVVVGVPDDYYLFAPITEALRYFMDAKPGVAVEMRAGLAANHLRDLRNRDLDLALVRQIRADADDVLRTDRLVWVGSSTWRLPANGVVPLAAVDGECAYRKAATEALDKGGVPWKCKFSCTSLEGVLAVVRAGLAVSVVIAGDATRNLSIINDHTVLPPLPVTALSILYSQDEPNVISRALARTITSALEHI